MLKSRTFFAYATSAAAKQAGRTRRAFLAGSMTPEQFHEIRAKQDRTAHNRIEAVMARTIPHYQPRFV